MKPTLAVLLVVVGSALGQNLARCTVYGTAHVRSFDDRYIHVGGNCAQDLARTCPPRPGKVEGFSVTMRTSRAQAATFVEVRSEELNTRVYATGNVEINGVPADAVNINCTFSVQRVPQGTRISLSNLGVSILVNENGLIVVEIPRNYKGAMCGLCGNFDGNPDNDPQDSMCDDSNDDDPKACLSKEGFKAFANSESLCGVFKSKAVGRSFSDCIAAFPDVAADYYDSCLRDFCVSQNAFSEDGSGCTSANDCGFYENFAKDSACRVAEAFAEECARRKTPDYSWRASYDCAKTCPNGSRYERSTAACPPWCRSTSDCQRNRPQDAWCKDATEGCACRAGFIWSGRTCVPQKQCGCLHNGIYYENGSRWLDSACKTELSCLDGVVSSHAFRCPALGKCKRDKDSGKWNCLCPEGYFESDASSCVRICNAGQRPKRGVHDCEPCPIGTYQPEARKADCLPCPPGTVTTAVGSDSMTQCIAIDAVSLADKATVSPLPMFACRDSGCVQEVRVPSTLFPTGLPFGRRRHRRIYVSTNGLITFGASYAGNVPESLVHYTFAHPKIAAFWVRQDLISNLSFCTVSQHGYDYVSVEGLRTARISDSSGQLQLFSHLLRTFGSAPASFRATWALEVNWISTIPYPKSWYWNPVKAIEESFTYQLFLVSDGISTYVMFHYPKGMLRTSRTQTNHFRKIFMGFNAGDNETVFDYQYAGGINITSLDEQNNTGHGGWWSFKVAGPSGILETRTDAAASRCLEWYSWQKDTILMPITQHSWHCPCDLATGRNDPTFIVNGTCAISLRAHAKHGFYQMCCYDQRQGPTAGTLLIDDRAAGRPIRHNPYLDPAEYLLYDNEPYQDCCGRSPYCHLYRRVRPPDKCDGYVAPKRADIFGDPHFFTFDNVGYTYNPVGEFILTSADNFKAQVRLGRSGGAEAENFVNGSFVQAVAVQAELSSRVHAEVSGSDIIIYVSSLEDSMDVRRLSNDSPVELQQYDGVTVATAGSAVVITFDNGYSAQLRAAERFLQVSIYAPASARGSTKGLLGVNDDNVTNDFTLRNGTIVNCFVEKNFDECVHNAFGENWRVKNGESIMWYRGGRTDQDYTDHSFVPGLIGTVAATKAIDFSFCGNERTCIYDWLVTGSPAIANLTYHAAKKRQDAVATLGNRSPVIKGGRTALNVTAGNPLSWLIEVFDPDGDEVFLTEIDMPPGINRTTVERGKYLYTWLQPSLDAINHSIRLLAVESFGQRKRSPELVTQIRFCDGCHNQGVCAFDTEIPIDRNEVFNENAVLVACECAAGWTGYSCTVGEDVCSSMPCPYTECQATNDQRLPYSCAACPNATVNLAAGSDFDNSSECFDNDECINEELACVPGTCTNTYGSYFCSCKNGFEVTHNSSNCPVLYVSVVEGLSFEWPRPLRDADIAASGDVYIAISTALISSWTSIAGVVGIKMQLLNPTTKVPSTSISGLEVTYILNCENAEQPLDITKVLHQRSILITANTMHPTVLHNQKLFNISWPRYTWPNQSIIPITCRTQNACQSDQCFDILGVPKCKLPGIDTGSNDGNRGKDQEISATDLLPVWITVGVIASVAAVAGLSCCFIIIVRRRQGGAQLHRSRSESLLTVGSNVLSTPRTYRLQFPSSFSSRSSNSSGDDIQQQVASAPPRPKGSSAIYGPRWPRAYISRRHPPIPEDNVDENSGVQS